MNSVKLSVNINKWATLRNARGHNNPDIVATAIRVQQYGANGVTIHPRPDERHIRYADVEAIKPVITTEFNIEGYPSPDFVNMVLQAKPTQVTLVPDPPGALTSSFGWDCITHQELLKSVIQVFNNAGIRTSVFVDPNPAMMFHCASTGANRVELYTENYATNYHINKEQAVLPFVQSAQAAISHNLGVNAGHDLDLQNLHFFLSHVPQVLEVSIGHALICDAIEHGLQNTIQMYKARCQPDFQL